MNKYLKGLGGWMLDLFYPPICPYCNEYLAVGEELAAGVHKRCYEKLKPVGAPYCLKCGKPLTAEETACCRDCSIHRRSFEYGRALWVYEAVSAEGIFLYKYMNRRTSCRFFGRALAGAFGDWIISLNVDCLVPVPASPERKRKRGYDQTLEMVKVLADCLNLPVEERGLYRRTSTSALKKLGRRERLQMLKDAFCAKREAFKGIKRVLLVDDIYTSGSTMEACTLALKSAGVEMVWCLSLCIGSI